MKFQTPTGMHDVFGEDMGYLDKIEKTIRKIVDFYNFSKISTPILEDTKLFEKGTGGSTDIVEKQMYSLRTRGGDSLTLRPEFTPGVVRAYIQHGMHAWPKPVKLWYMGPLFRYERPQAGRYRQFSQIDLEIFGEESPVADAQLILIACNLFKELQLNIEVQINSIGCKECRPEYIKKLTEYYKQRRIKSKLCEDCKKRLLKNPMRLLDCKEEGCEEGTDVIWAWLI